jgi:hypothetical protein
MNKSLLALTFAFIACAAENKSERMDRVLIQKLPASAIEPQVAQDAKGTLHLIYYSGDPKNGDILYVRSIDSGATFTKPLRVNSVAGSALAMGTIRGAQIAVGRNSRVHVSWFGSAQAPVQGPINPESGKPGAPMLYARMNDAGTGFEPEINLMQHSFGLDGGGSVAADQDGNVYVAWHGVGMSDAKNGKEGEARRAVWFRRSSDDGKTFQAEDKAWRQETGACGCCGMKMFADRQGTVYSLYRSATESVHRDIYLLSSKDKGKSFAGSLLHKWEINACPMSSMDFAENSKGVVASWETGGQVYWARIDLDHRPSMQAIAAPGEGKGRKHPRVAVSANGDILLVWTEGTGWQRGGTIAWQIYNAEGKPIGETGRAPGLPAWSFAAAVPKPDGGFSILY